MTDELLEQRLQDYLDDRLSEVERERFDERIRSDPELAEQIADHLALRAALGEQPAELPAGFVERARARFEAAHPPRSRWGRWVSWEAAGLAAAALLLTAILLPGQLDRHRPWATADTARDLSAPAKESAPRKVETVEDRPDEGRDASADSQTVVQQEPVSGPFAPVPSEPLARADTDAPADDTEARADRYEIDEVEQTAVAEKAPTRPAKRLESNEELHALGAAKLAPGVTDSSTPWHARVIDNEQEWSEFVRYARQRAKTDPTPAVDFTTQRVVLVETGSGSASCAANRWHLEGDTLVIELPVPDASRPQTVRCQIVVPAGDESVELRTLEVTDGR